MRNISKLSFYIVLVLQMMLFEGCGRKASNSDTSSNIDSPSGKTEEPLEVYIDGVSTSVRTAKIRNENVGMVNAALERLEEGQRIEVVETVESQCDGTPAKYVISKINGELNLSLDVMYTPADGTNKDDFFSGIEQVKSCLPEIETFFLQYNIQFNLNIYSSAPSKNIKTLNKVQLTSKAVRSHSGLYSMQDIAFCKTVLHEVGHLFGLQDEYHEPGTCRTEDQASKDVYPHSLMGALVHTRHLDGTVSTRQMELFPRHFKTVLAAIYDKQDVIINEDSFPEPKRFTLTLKKDLVPTTKSKGWAELTLISSKSDFKGRMSIVSRLQDKVIDIVPAGTKLVFKNAEGIISNRRVRKRDGSLDTRTRYFLDFNEGIKTRDDLYLGSFGVDYYTNKSKISGLKEALEEFGYLD